MDNLNEQQGFSQEDRDNENLIENTMTPAQHWSKIKELAKTIELGAQDLQEALDEYNGL